MKKIGNLFILVTISCILNGFILRAMDIEFPLIQSMVFHPFFESEILGQKKSSFSLNLNYSSIFMVNEKENTFNDMELVSINGKYRYGIWDGLNLEISQRIIFIYGGFLDGTADFIHKTLGWAVEDRERFPRNSIHYAFGDQFAYTTPTLALSQLYVGIMTDLFRRQSISVSIRSGLGVPLFSKAGLASHQPFLSAGALIAYSKKNWSWQTGITISTFRPPSWLINSEMKRILHVISMSGHINRIIGGIFYRSSPFKYGDLANSAVQFYLGFKLSKRLDFIFTEEFPPLDTTPDATFRLCWRIL
jgi:hypothetical protein